MGKVLLVIGATSDFGTSLIENTEQDYDMIYAHYRRENDALLRMKSNLGSKLVPIQADLNDEDSVLNLVNTIKDSNVYPDHIVFFAAPHVKNGHFHKMPISCFDEALNISVRSTVLICQGLIPFMVKKKYGRIVMMLSSVILNSPEPYCSHYITEKYAMYGLMRALSSEYVAKGITVNGVSPSYTDTNYIKNIPDIIVEKHIEQNPIGRLLSIDEVISPIKFLLSDEANAISGVNMPITYGK